jgi:hypothetical protein
MPTIMADHNVEGQFQVLLGIWTSAEWYDIWESLSCETQSFHRLGIPYNTSDSELWRLCQQHEIVLITGNRNANDTDSLEATIREQADAASLPVLTIADPDRIMTSRDYAERVAAQVLDYLMELEKLRGAGRLYVP